MKGKMIGQAFVTMPGEVCSEDEFFKVRDAFASIQHYSTVQFLRLCIQDFYSGTYDSDDLFSMKT